MTISILVEPSQAGFRATTGGPLDLSIEAVPLWPVFRDGFVVALLNPKTAIFFTAFLPQFMTPDAIGSAALVQALALSAFFVRPDLANGSEPMTNRLDSKRQIRAARGAE